MAKSSSKKDSKKDGKTLKGAAAKLKKVVSKLVGKPAKAATKPAAKTPAKAGKAAVKETKKPVKKAAVEVSSKKETVKESAKKEAIKPSKVDKLAAEKAAIEKMAAKSKKDSAKGKKAKKAKPEEELEEDLVGESDDFGSNELDEYEEELEIATEEIEIDEQEWTDDAAALPPPAAEDFITDAEGNRICRVRDCDQIARVDAHCRYHYLLLWKKIQVRKKILVDGKLERYVEELTARYPDKFLEVIRRDLRSEKEFLAAIQELEIDESNVDSDFEEESQSFIDEVRGNTTEGLTDDEEF